MSKPTKQPAHNGDGEQDHNKDESKKQIRPKVDAYMKYSGMAIQMGVIILLGTLAGQWLDGYFGTERPYFTVLLALLAIFAALYLTLKDIIHPSNKDNKRQ
ncbi:MAG TPA: AtpZ/AtpI family protein [Phaeodactylibacter sp.]|nr:AtpZ/AtpI family protein [Phaeodactylibacter sp.]